MTQEDLRNQLGEANTRGSPDTLDAASNQFMYTSGVTGGVAEDFSSSQGQDSAYMEGDASTSFINLSPPPPLHACDSNYLLNLDVSEGMADLFDMDASQLAPDVAMS